MFKLTLLAVFALICALSLPSLAATSTGKPSEPNLAAPTAQAKAALDRLAALYKSAQTLEYASTITTSAPGQPASADQSFQVKAYIQRPNLVRLEIDNAGKESALVVSNGANAYAFDAASNKYFEYPAAESGPAAIVAPLDSSTPLLGPVIADAEFTAMMFAVPHPYDLSNSPAPGRFHLWESSATLDGRPITHVIENASSGGTSVSLNIYLDKETGLPKRVTEDLVQNGIRFEPLREDFASIQLGTTPLLASNFTWSPPAGATVFSPPPAQDDSDKPALADGTVAPEFSTETIDGQEVHLSDFKGKVVVLDFWATWCGPCQMALPYTDKIARAYAPKGVIFLPICSGDTKEAFQTWLEAHKSMFMRFYYDPPDAAGKGNVIGDLYKVEAIPTQYVIGKDGKIAGGFLGYDAQDDPNENALKQAIDKALSAS